MQPVRRRGIALVEIVTVVLLLMVVVALAAGPIRSSRKRARMSICASHLRELGRVASLYAEDYGRYPDPQRWVQLTPDRRWLYCPEDEGHRSAGSSYTFRCLLPSGFQPYWRMTRLPPETVLAICGQHLEQKEETPGDPRRLTPPRFPYKLVLRANGAVDTVHVDGIRELVVPGERPRFAWIYPGEPGYERATR